MDAKLFEEIFQRRAITTLKIEPELRIATEQDTPMTDDFGLEIKELLLSREVDKRELSPLKSQLANKPVWDGITFLHTPNNLKNVADKLGFVVIESSSFYYVRDSFIRLWDATIRLPRESQCIEKAMEHTHSSNLYLNKTSTTRTRNQLFNHWSGFSGQYLAQSHVDAELLFPGKWHSFDYAYVEGGNVYTLINNKGRVSLLLGEDQRTQTLQILELEGQNWELLASKSEGANSFCAITEDIGDTLSLDDIRHTCQEMYSLGMWNYQGKTGIIPQQAQLSIMLAKFFVPGVDGWVIPEEEAGWFRLLAEQSGFIAKIDLTDEEAERLRSIAANYLAKIKIVERLIALDFNLPKEDVHFITQVNYHLDEFILPAPGHAFFLLNYAFCAEMLEVIIKNYSELGVSENDLLLLEGYLQASKKFDRELGPLLKDVEAQLQSAGFTVIPCPGHFLYEPKEMYQQFPMPSEGICINFMNALTGWSSKTQGYYYITHGLHAGEQVGKLCMEAYSLFLKHYLPNISLFFIGYDPENSEDFSEALDFWNRLETQSGVHCTTFPL
ncbi:MAG: hypothetical protein H0T62_05700 [Parachlamydiaceae bacterium]|nr:hypothetical protein [Parachlamydiaceae bacterium]